MRFVEFVGGVGFWWCLVGFSLGVFVVILVGVLWLYCEEREFLFLLCGACLVLRLLGLSLGLIASGCVDVSCFYYTLCWCFAEFLDLNFVLCIRVVCCD